MREQGLSRGARATATATASWGCPAPSPFAASSPGAGPHSARAARAGRQASRRPGRATRRRGPAGWPRRRGRSGRAARPARRRGLPRRECLCRQARSNRSVPLPAPGAPRQRRGRGSLAVWEMGASCPRAASSTPLPRRTSRPRSTAGPQTDGASGPRPPASTSATSWTTPRSTTANVSRTRATALAPVWARARMRADARAFAPDAHARPRRLRRSRPARPRPPSWQPTSHGGPGSERERCQRLPRAALQHAARPPPARCRPSCAWPLRCSSRGLGVFVEGAPDVRSVPSALGARAFSLAVQLGVATDGAPFGLDGPHSRERSLARPPPRSRTRSWPDRRGL